MCVLKKWLYENYNSNLQYFFTKCLVLDWTPVLYSGLTQHFSISYAIPL